MCGGIPLLPHSTAWCGAKLSTSITLNYHSRFHTPLWWEATVQTASMSDTRPTQPYVFACSHFDICEVFLPFWNKSKHSYGIFGNISLPQPCLPVAFSPILKLVCLCIYQPKGRCELVPMIARSKA